MANQHAFELMFDVPEEETDDDPTAVLSVPPAGSVKATGKPRAGRGTKARLLASATAVPTPVATLADLLALIRAWPGLSPKKRRDLVSAVLSIARLLGLPPELIPVDVAELRRRLAAVHPASIGMSAKRFANIKADLVRALKLAGRAVTGAHARTPLASAWRALRDASQGPLQWRLMGLMRWCSAEGIAPEGVDDATLDAFLDHLERTALELGPAAFRRQVATSWNACVDAVPGWPRRRLEVRPAREPWATPLEAYPPELGRDVDACLDRLAGTDLLDEDGPDQPLRPATLKWRRFQIRAAAASLVAAGVPAGEICSLADLLRPDRFKLLINNLLQRYGKKTGFIYGLATAMKSIARHHCKLDDRDLDDLRKICRKVRVKQRGLTSKNRERLRPFTDPDTRDRLLLLPQRLMKEACRGEPGKGSALTAQMAVLLEIGLMAPMRAANLASLEIGRSLVFLGRGRQEHAVVTLPEEEVKNEVALDYPLLPESTKLVRLYVDRFLPLLAPPGTTHLFPSPNGGAKHPGGLSTRVAALIREAIGHRVNLHLLRHFAAMLYLQAYPGAYEAVRRLLGHATASAALDCYVGLETTAAARHFDELVLRLRRQAEAKEPRRRQLPGRRRGGRR